MQCLLPATILSAFTVTAAFAGPLNISPPSYPSSGFLTTRPPAIASAPSSETTPAEAAPARAQRAAFDGPSLGGGFFEFLFGGGSRRAAPAYRPAPATVPQSGYYAPSEAVNPRYLKQEVVYGGLEKPGTIIINTNERLLYLVQGNGQAIRYGIGVGRPGFTWAGVHHVSQMREWPDWTPPPQMLTRRPDLPRHMAGGPDNPLGARALYLGSTLYRIHGSNEPWTIGTAVSSGCIRMRNEDVVDLYARVKVGAKVVVI